MKKPLKWAAISVGGLFALIVIGIIATDPEEVRPRATKPVESPALQKAQEITQTAWQLMDLLLQEGKVAEIAVGLESDPKLASQLTMQASVLQRAPSVLTESVLDEVGLDVVFVTEEGVTLNCVEGLESAGDSLVGGRCGS